MAVNTRTEYALRALLEIEDQKGGNVSAQTICERQKLPKKYVEHLLSALKGAGLVTSSTGSRGGYVLARPARKISLLDVLTAVDDHSPELGCSMGGQFCLGDACGLKNLFHDVDARQRELFDSYTLDRIKALWKGKQA